MVNGWRNIANLKETLVYMVKCSKFELEQILTAIYGKFRKKRLNTTSHMALVRRGLAVPIYWI